MDRAILRVRGHSEIGPNGVVVQSISLKRTMVQMR